MDSEEVKKVRFERYLKYQERTKDIIHYGTTRFDLLIIAISGGGIYVVLEVLKFLIANNLCVRTEWLKVSGFVFTAAVITNFVAQITSMSSNRLTSRSKELDIDDYLEGISDEEKQSVDALEKKSDRWNYWTKWLNWTSAGLMFIGLIIISVFTSLVF